MPEIVDGRFIEEARARQLRESGYSPSVRRPVLKERDTTPTKLVTQHSLRSGEVVIEIDNEHESVYQELVVDDQSPWDSDLDNIRERRIVAGNRHQHFPPVETRSFGNASYNFIRTRQVLERIGGRRMRFSLNSSLDSIDHIPGERIHIDLETKIGRVTDGVFDRENEAIRLQLKNAAKKREGLKGLFVPAPYVEVDMSTDDHAFWTWVFEMRKICDGDFDHNAGPTRHRGCATEGPRLCRPVQNVDLLPTREECLASGKLRMFLPPMSQRQYDAWNKERTEHDPENIFNPQAWTCSMTEWATRWVSTMFGRHF